MTEPTDQPIEHVEGQEPLPDNSAPAPAEASPVPYADEYVVPDPEDQAALDELVPDEPTPLDGDGTEEGDDQ
jgi:hypothetical protein